MEIKTGSINQLSRLIRLNCSQQFQK